MFTITGIVNVYCFVNILALFCLAAQLKTKKSNDSEALFLQCKESQIFVQNIANLFIFPYSLNAHEERSYIPARSFSSILSVFEYWPDTFGIH